MADLLTLRDAAEYLGVHYMTVYRYVRLGRLPAFKDGAQWRVRTRDLDAFGQAPKKAIPKTRWDDRLFSRLTAGDESGAWQVVEAALASGHDASSVYLTMVSPAMARIGDEWADGSLDVATEHRASAIALRLVGRLGALMRPRGRRKGRIVIGAPSGERHGLPLAMVSDMLRAVGYDVTDLGGDVPEDSFLAATRESTNLTAVGVGVSHAASLRSGRRLVRRLRSELAPGVLILAGGAAVASADDVGADFHAVDGPAAIQFLRDGNGR